MGKGYYTKHFNIAEDTILSFDANCKTKDNHYEAGKLCNTNDFQMENVLKVCKLVLILTIALLQ